MKALKSPLAKAVLTDRKASEQLRMFLASKPRPAGNQTPVADVMEIQFEGKTLRLTPMVVPKAG